MAPFVTHGNQIAIASEDSIFHIDTSTGITRHAIIPALKIEPEKKQPESKTTADESNKKDSSNPEDASHVSSATCLKFSNCASHLAVCTSQKNLTLWNTSTFEVVRQWKTCRKVSALAFSSDGSQLFVADKTGDCYVYKINEDTDQGKLLLGHLSMLLDIAIAEGDKFVITAERDEKIRVSCLPNAYNIHTFCLGHTEFVSSLALINDKLLLSGSGDATLKLWDFTTGQLLHSENLRLPSEDNMQMAVRSIVLYKLSDEISIAAVVLNKEKKLLLIKIKIKETKFETQVLVFNSQPLETSFAEDGSLYVLTDDPTKPIEFFIRDSASVYTAGQSTVVETLITNANYQKTIQGCISSCNGDMKPLYKRWFDNVQAFRERKQYFKEKSQDTNGACDAKRVRTE